MIPGPTCYAYHCVYAAVRRFRARRFLDAARLLRWLFRRFGRDTDRLADRDTLTLADFDVEGAFGVAARRRRAARRFFEDDWRFFCEVLFVFLDRDTLTLADLAVEGAFGVAARRRRAARRFIEALRFLERDLDADRLRRRDRDTLTLGDLAVEGAFGVAARRRRAARRFFEEVRRRFFREALLRFLDRDTLTLVDLAVEGALGVAARRRAARRFLEALRFLERDLDAERLREMERDLETDGDLAFTEPFGVAARRRRRRLRDRDALFRRLGCIGFFPPRALPADADAARFLAFRSAWNASFSAWYALYFLVFW